MLNICSYLKFVFILLVLEIQRFKSVKACRPKNRHATVNANSSTNNLRKIDGYII
ncbi:MAG: hypothetical protein LBP59_13100 [Planctomycetaceae bacterium]|nr:hypothetical protein [Planctomycetaceae bacterium]